MPVALILPVICINAKGVTVKATPFESTPPTFTTIFPLVIPEGAGQEIEAALQLETVQATPLNFTVDVL